jgi:hypothetical protein
LTSDIYAALLAVVENAIIDAIKEESRAVIAHFG